MTGGVMVAFKWAARHGEAGWHRVERQACVLRLNQSM